MKFGVLYDSIGIGGVKMKKCHMCLLEKEDNEFNKRRCNQCKLCEKKWKKEWHQRNKKRLNKKAKIYNKKNSEKIKANRKIYYIKNKEHIDTQNILNREKNREYFNKKSREYYHKNKKHIHKKQKLYLSSNKEAKIRHNLRVRINHVLQGKIKSGGTIELLGCTAEFLAMHIEQQFKDGMSWENYGRNGWHIDHIIPCSSFDLTDPEQQRKCFHYSNLQPLWAEDNLRKSDKIL